VQAWQIGQILQATVVAVTAPDRVVLMMAGRRFEAQVQSPAGGTLPGAGERLTLQVDANGPPVLLRNIPVSPPGESAVGAGRAADVQRAAVREALPRARPLGTALETLARLSEHADAAPDAPLPLVRILSAVRDVLQTTPDLSRVTTSAGLRQAVEESGAFLESRLAALAGTGSRLTLDLKASLLQLAELLSKATVAAEALARPPASAQATAAPGPAPAHPPPSGPAAGVVEAPAPGLPPVGPLQGQVEGALARIELNQLRSVPLGDGPHPGWLVEVPVRTPEGFDLLSLHIERRQGRGGVVGDDLWQLSLRLDLEPLGPLQATVVWQRGSLSATLRAEREATAQVLRDRSGELLHSLRDAGLPTATVRCLHGRLCPDQGPPLPEHLLDLRA
jgi:hypothetical protein